MTKYYKKIILPAFLFIPFFVIQSTCAQEEGSAKGQFRKINEKIKGVFINPYLKEKGINLDETFVMENYAIERDNNGELTYNIPVEAGRAVQLPFKLSDRAFLLAKGTGVNKEFTVNNAIRYKTDTFQPKDEMFDGKFSYAEAIEDMYNAEFLSRIGVNVALPLAILKLGESNNSDVIYVRAFKEQLRISNLARLTDLEVKNALSRVIDSLYEKKITYKRLSISEYFFFLTHEMAKNVARMQAAGYQHGVFHNQQVTLLGEITDLGTGYWKNTENIHEYNKSPKSPYFDFKFQPILAQNMLFRSHALTTTTPSLLANDSNTKITQNKSLLGAILRAFPEEGKKIMESSPEVYFWKYFDRYYRQFNQNYFQKNFKPTDYLSFNDNVAKENGSKSLSNQWFLKEQTEVEFTQRNYFIDTYIGNAITSKLDIKDPLSQQLLNFFKDINGNTTLNSALSQQELNAFKLKVNQNSSKLNSIKDKFSNDLKILYEKYNQQRDIQNYDLWMKMLDLLSQHTKLNFGAPNSWLGKFLYFKRYYFGGINIDHIVDSRRGHCNDQCFLTYNVAQELKTYEPNIQIVMAKAKNQRAFFGNHYFVIIKLPDDSMHVLDPIMGSRYANVPLQFLTNDPYKGSILFDMFSTDMELLDLQDIKSKNRCDFFLQKLEY